MKNNKNGKRKGAPQNNSKKCKSIANNAENDIDKNENSSP